METQIDPSTTSHEVNSQDHITVESENKVDVRTEVEESTEQSETSNTENSNSISDEKKEISPDSTPDSPNKFATLRLKQKRTLSSVVQLTDEFTYKNKKTSLKLTATQISFSKLPFNPKETPFVIKFEDLVGVEHHPKSKTTLVIYAYQRSRPDKPRERHLYTLVHDSQDVVNRWIRSIRCSLREVSPDSVPPRPKMLVFVNPASGKGKAIEVWNNVKDMFEVADIDVTVFLTTHTNHAAEIIGEYNLEGISGIVIVSGDGMLYEVVNGLLNRKDWNTVRNIPLGVIPGGSGNGVAANLKAFNPVVAAFYIIKGKTLPVDICSVLQGEKRYYSILSVTWSIVADIDVDSEKYRWMGGMRFTFTAINKILSKLTPRHGKLWYLPSDVKEKQLCDPKACKVCSSDVKEHEEGLENPPLNWVEKEEKNNWISVEGDFSFFVATNLRQLSGDTKVAPYAHLSDGHIDLLFAKPLSRPKLTKLLLDIEEGKHIDMKDIEYHKVKAFVLEPTANNGVIMVDGERVPEEPVRVELHPSLVRLFVEPY